MSRYGQVHTLVRKKYHLMTSSSIFEIDSKVEFLLVFSWMCLLSSDPAPNLISFHDNVWSSMLVPLAYQLRHRPHQQYCHRGL